MKKAILILCLLAGVTTYAQTGSGIGLKGGLNFGANGDLTESIGNPSSNSVSKLGFHVGVFGKMDFGTLYFRPELAYSRLNSKYDDNDFKMNKLDMPLLVGLNILDPVHIFAGPALQYILDTELENVTLADVKNKFTVGFNIGAGIDFSDELGLDLRYERGFSENEAEILGVEGNPRLDTRPSQLILGLSYKF